MTGCTVIFNYKQYKFLQNVLLIYGIYLDLLSERLEVFPDDKKVCELVKQQQQLDELQATIKRYY